MPGVVLSLRAVDPPHSHMQLRFRPSQPDSVAVSLQYLAYAGGQPGRSLHPVPGGHGGQGEIGGGGPIGRNPQLLRHHLRLPDMGSPGTVGLH